MNTNVLIISSFAVGAAVGGGATYVVVKKRYRALADAEVASVKEVFARIGDISSRGDSAPEAEESPAGSTAVEPTVTDHVPYNKIIRNEGYAGSEQPIQDSEVDSREVESVTVKVEPTSAEIEEVRVEYATHNPAYQQEAVVMAAMYEERGGDKPYLIGISEFMTECENFRKSSMTWYAGDNTLVDDDNDEAIDDLRLIGGDRLFLAFGDDQHNSDTIYIRNEEAEIDFEILRNPLPYRDIALGDRYQNELDAESQRRGPRKMRSDG